MAKKALNIGMVGYGFMGRAHSNAYRTVGNFFELGYQPVLKAVAARNADKAKGFADMWGYESVESDWRELIRRKDIDAIDAHYLYPDGVAAAMLARAFGKPLVLTARGSDVNVLARYPTPRRLILRALALAAQVITVSKSLRTELGKRAGTACR